MSYAQGEWACRIGGMTQPIQCSVRLYWVAALTLVAIAPLARAAPKGPIVDFARDVRPILSDNCFKCHGPDQKTRKSGLRLDVRDDALDVLQPEPGGTSELILRVTSEDAADRMPPPKSKLTLTAREIDVLRRWISQGANYTQHWSFTPLGEPALPKIERRNWALNPIDHFVLSRLEREGMAPTAPASRERLIRRVSFDLTGLPPTLEQIDAFVNDKSKDAFEKLVDRLLASEAYGERMAADWLDVARYSDTYGYQVDRDRYVWPWRDWVIRAFNRNMPFDEFVKWQLAGDLLPGAGDEQLLATTFNRLHPQKVEGGSTPEEFRVEYVADRTHTFGTAFLGLTLECARCHTHKYDPISQKEYYQFFAFFNNIDEAGLYSYFTRSVPTPTLLLTDAGTKSRIADVEEKVRSAEQQLATISRERRVAFEAWLGRRPGKAVISGQVAHLDFENHKNGANVSVPGKVGKAVRLSGDDGIGLKVGNFRRYDPFSVALWMNTPDVKKRAVVFHRSRAWTDAGSRGYQLLIENGRLSASLIHFWPGNALRVRTRDPIPSKQWVHVAMTYDGSSRADGLRIYIDGKVAAVDIVRDNLYKNISGGGGDNLAIGQRFRDRGFTNGSVDEFKVFNRELTAIEAGQLYDGQRLTKALAAPVDKLTDTQRAELYRLYLATEDAEFGKGLATLRAAREQRSKTVDGLGEIMVMREMAKRRQSFVLIRGAYDAPGEPVAPGTPASLPPFPADLPRNRLGLAQWLTDKEHPLTARVAVNRLWQLCFGDGLVRTPEDFGSQGQAPTHPELLDWLARDFVAHGWDVKRLLKQIVTSATYRQDSTVTPSLLARDPENRLLARGPSHRLPAEMLRDNALAASGLLVRRIGGSPAKPYEVTVSFKPMGRDKGEGLYRRSLYTFWKRTGPAPAMMALDASKRDVCRVKRERTSSPIQAFVLLNGPQFVESARILGQRLLKKHGDDRRAFADELFRVLTSRRPTEPERAALVTLFEDQLAHFQKNAAAAQAFLKVGDAAIDKRIVPARLAAAAVVASMMMNYDESVMKR